MVIQLVLLPYRPHGTSFTAPPTLPATPPAPRMAALVRYGQAVRATFTATREVALVSARWRGAIVIVAAVVSAVESTALVRTASGADPWSPPVDLAQPGDSPLVGADDAGNVIAIWSNGGVRAARLDIATKTWTTTIVAATGGEDVQLAVDPAGNAFAVWVADLGTPSPARVVATRYSAPTGTWSTPVTVATGVWPALAVDPAGNAIVVFASGLGCQGGSCASSLVFARYDVNAGSWGPATDLATGKNPIYTDVGFDSTGNAIAVWTDRDSLS